MNEVICPHCHKAFKIDEAGYADILKQVRDSAFEQQLHERLELAEKELAEIAVISEFLPRQLSGDEVAQAIRDAIAEAGASSIRDMGKVMAVLKGKYTGQMDFGAVGPTVKDMLA